MSMNALPSARSYHPTTFQERGVALPFTTPSLGGARARLSHNRGIELIVRNLAGGRGVYVMPLNAVTALCRSTLHDKVVGNRIAFLETVTPATVRAIGRSTAGEGLAGEGAMQAARKAAQTDAADRQVVVDHLLSSLIRQVNTGPNASGAVPGPEPGPRRQSTADHCVARPASRAVHGMGRQGAGCHRGYHDRRFGGIGGSGGWQDFPPRQCSARMREQIAEWADTQRDGDSRGIMCAMRLLDRRFHPALRPRV